MRRGQVTLFIVIGLALLIGVLLFLLLRPAYHIEESRVGVVPVGQLIDDCTTQSLERLLRIAGANGGYLDTSGLRHAGLPWEGDTVPFPPQDVALWSHVKPCSNPLGCEASEQPPLCTHDCPLQLSFNTDRTSVQEQIEQALPGTVIACLDNFTKVKDKYEVTFDGEGKATVLFTKNVIANLDMPVTITNRENGERRRLERFTAEAPVDLLQLYMLAYHLAQAERNSSYLERLTLNLLVLYSGVKEKLPPMRSVTLLGRQRYWSRTAVEKILQEEILPWSDFIQVPNAVAGYRPIIPPSNLSAEEQAYRAGTYANLYVVPDTTQYEDVKARFFYPGTRPFLAINGGKELLKPRSVNFGGLVTKMLGLFINDYRFRYDLAYPVIVTLTDESAFNGKGYDWSFGLEANIWRNEPLNRSLATTRFTLVNQRADLASPLQRVKNALLISTTNKETGEPLAGVRITYACGEEWFIGETDEQGRLATRMPYCRYGGLLSYSKAGYLGSGISYDNYEEDVTHRFSFALWPLQNITFTVRKRTPRNIENLTTGPITQETIRRESAPLNTTDLVLLTITRLNETPYEDDVPLVGFTTLALADQNMSRAIAEQQRQLEQLQKQGLLTEQDVADWFDEMSNRKVIPSQPNVTFSLAPGRYKLEAYLFHNDQVSLSEETRSYCAGPKVLGVCANTKHFTLNATNFTTWLSGGAFLNESHPFALTPNALYNFKNYTLYLLEEEIPATWKELEAYVDPQSYARGKELLMMPQPGEVVR